MNPPTICIIVLGAALFGLLIGAKDRGGSFSHTLMVVLVVCIIVLIGAEAQSQLTEIKRNREKESPAQYSNTR